MELRLVTGAQLCMLEKPIESYTSKEWILHELCSNMFFKTEMQILRLTPDLLNQNLHFNKITRWFPYVFKFEKHWCLRNTVKTASPVNFIINHYGTVNLISLGQIFLVTIAWVIQSTTVHNDFITPSFSFKILESFSTGWHLHWAKSRALAYIFLNPQQY